MARPVQEAYPPKRQLDDDSTAWQVVGTEERVLSLVVGMKASRGKRFVTHLGVRFKGKEFQPRSAVLPLEPEWWEGGFLKDWGTEISCHGWGTITESLQGTLWDLDLILLMRGPLGRERLRWLQCRCSRGHGLRMGQQPQERKSEGWNPDSPSFPKPFPFVPTAFSSISCSHFLQNNGQWAVVMLRVWVLVCRYGHLPVRCLFMETTSYLLLVLWAACGSSLSTTLLSPAQPLAQCPTSKPMEMYEFRRMD